MSDTGRTMREEESGSGGIADPIRRVLDGMCRDEPFVPEGGRDSIRALRGYRGSGALPDAAAVVATYFSGLIVRGLSREEALALAGEATRGMFAELVKPRMITLGDVTFPEDPGPTGEEVAMAARLRSDAQVLEARTRSGEAVGADDARVVTETLRAAAELLDPDGEAAGG